MAKKGRTGCPCPWQEMETVDREVSIILPKDTYSSIHRERQFALQGRSQVKGKKKTDKEKGKW